MFTQARAPTVGGSRSFQFDGVVFHSASGQLELLGNTATLRPRTAAVLEYLLRHHDRLVAKDELLDAVWSGSVVTEDSLTQCIKEIRRSLTPAHAHVIRTVPRAGFRVAVPVVSQVDCGPLLETKPSASAQQATSWASVLGGVLTLALMVGLMGVAAVRNGRAPPSPPLSILVLPFSDPDPGERGSWLGDVLASELTVRLGQTAGTQVISADTARAFRNTDVLPRAAAAALGVRYVLTGSVSRFDNQVRVRLVLTDGRSGMQRWARQVLVDRERVHLSMEELAQQVARSLSVEMHRGSGEAVARLGPSQVQADDLAMQGWAVYFRGLTPDNLRASAALFEAAVDGDHGSVRGWGGVAVAQGMAAYTHWAEDRPAAVKRLHEALTRLHDLDADGLEAHVGRSLAALIDSDWDAVLVINDAGLEKYPGHSPSHYARALALTRLGRFEECLESANKALKIGPRDHQAGAYHLQAGFCHFHMGEFTLAAQRARLAQEFSPRLDLPSLLLAASLSQSGDQANALRTVADFRQRRPAFRLAHATRLLAGHHERFVQGREAFFQTLQKLGMP